MAEKQLSGKRALVTGASSGLGEHFARLLAENGADVVVAARRVERLERLVGGIAEEFAVDARALALDVTDSGSVRDAIGEAGDIDILVNNAGVTNSKPALDQTEEDFDWIVDTNLKGAYLVALEAARGMRERGKGGAMVNVASILGLRQATTVLPYAISKAGVVQMTRQLALELARYEIRVNALAPGYILTDINREFFSQAAGEKLIKRIPQRRLGQIEDLDGPLLLLVSDASRYMTGTVIPVDGGHLVSGL
ncbi:3-oxoacyl-ACP reductase [Novosphingobium marinum]|uniref:2-deoxy-D-gluconate 3-dehydrogenase n=1 Tax=Novosphingobium marinum TaxID=1514948 RepID=A0A7Y9XW65_9SPHN|nr:glucose 1-dehydrogenase [Novosphingobium marinum]NYH94515.1 hypothetical protein [Novosphingobium marinum]GGC22937.1 3-oxoacyl-ACP reductase [Novosphingobium marinum]